MNSVSKQTYANRTETAKYQKIAGRNSVIAKCYNFDKGNDVKKTSPINQVIQVVRKNRFLQDYGRLVFVGLLGVAIGATAFGIHYRSTSARLEPVSRPTSSSNEKAQASTDNTTQNQQTTTPTPAPTTDTPQPSTTPATNYTAPTIPKATEDPTLAWNDSYEYLENELANDANSIDTTLYDCGTINPDYNSVCAPYDGSGTLPLCQKLLADTTKAMGVPSIPYSVANNYWENGLSEFQSSAQTCIAKINAHSTVGSGTDVGYSVRNEYTAGVKDMESVAAAITQYMQKLAQ